MLATRIKGASSPVPKVLTYVGGLTSAFFGGTTNVNISLTSLTGGIASAPAEGDFVIIYFGSGSAADRTLNISNYDKIVDLYAGDTEDTNFIVCTKFMTSTPDTQFTITGGTGSNDDAGVVAVHVWRHVEPLGPYDAITQSVIASNTVLVNPPAITPSTPGAVVVAGGVGAHTGDVQTFSSSNLINFITAGSFDVNDSTVGLGSAAWTSGSFDPAQFTFSGTDTTNFSNCSATLALRPKQDLTKPIATYIGTTQTTTGSTTQTLTAVSIGTASSDRRVVLALGAVGTTSGFTFSSVTIGGVSATKHVENGGEIGVAIFSLNVSSGTTADIVITGNQNFNVAAHVFTVTGNSTNYDTGTSTNGSNASLTTAAINVSGLDVGIFVGAERSTNALSQTTSYGTITESADATFTANVNRRTCAGIVNYDSGLTPSTLTLTGTSVLKRVAIATFIAIT